MKLYLSILVKPVEGDNPPQLMVNAMFKRSRDAAHLAILRDINARLGPPWAIYSIAEIGLWDFFKYGILNINQKVDLSPPNQEK